MVAGKIFIACSVSLAIANMVYYAIYPLAVGSDILGGLVSTLASIIVVMALASLSTPIVSLSDTFIGFLVTIVTLVNLFFRVNVAGYTLGFGLFTNMLTLTESTAFGIGGIIILAMELIMFVSAMMIVNGAGN